MIERTLIVLKPDAVQRGLIGAIVSRFEAKGLQIAAMKLIRMSKELAARHYAIHEGKPFFPGLIEYITSGPVVAMVIKGPRAINVSRALMGKTFGYQAEPGTIRGDYGLSMTYNLIHGSDAPDTAEFEISLYFKEDEFVASEPALGPWITKPDEV